MKLSVVIPAYNEEHNIGKVLDSVKQMITADDEIIVVDDGSTDKTAEVAEEKNVRVIRHIVNEGKGSCVKEGIAAATGDIIVLIDGDGQDDPAEIPRLVLPIYWGADFVIGSRWLGEFHEGAISRLNFFVTVLITEVINLLFNSHITDSQAGFRCLRRDKLKGFELRSKEYEIETEMVIKAIKHKLKIVEVPVKRFKRPQGESKLRRLRQGVRILRLIIRERLFCARTAWITGSHTQRS